MDMGQVPYAGARGPLNAKVAVSRISEHFRFVLEESFVKKGFEFAVFLENDLLVAPDFLWLFRASAWLLTADPSLFCVSAWNDNGFSDAALLRAELNATRLFRTDYFPGLGWMIQNTTWFSLRPSWPRYPSTGWDHWLRHGGRQQLELAASAESGGSGAARECVAPEVSRTHHFDQRGTNVKVGTPMAKKLSKMAFSTAKPHELGDLSYLLKENYQDLLHELLRKAILVSAEQVEHLEPMKAYLVPFVRRDYKKLAQKLQITEAQPRSSHEGLIATRDPKSGAAVFLANRLSSPWLPSTEQAFPHEQRHVAAARPGESCADMCQRLRMICSDFELEFINDCAALKAHFPCEEGCGHQVGEEIPCYVHEASRDTGKQCLVTDDAIPRCGAKNQATSRLCSCIPA
ncbi:3-mannosyl-glycoprotein 2-beta-N-acetylglucosaminyltransferase (N-glycosyl-oligosaccharide-glycoprotein N-acetylglucosaminyltransferase I) (GNT-I) (GlcNAc-T I) [Durusdinium trenchii]|uniref:alpha-1,3-mannosyl-glycoprotein 2-beta-N-acetylglucosaminyltransferase n=1 Tax=Durusdinium trenchii TaxID=1381693 RepID=A0ABP0L3E3_9DINO